MDGPYFTPRLYSSQRLSISRNCDQSSNDTCNSPLVDCNGATISDSSDHRIYWDRSCGAWCLFGDVIANYHHVEAATTTTDSTKSSSFLTPLRVTTRWDLQSGAGFLVDFDNSSLFHDLYESFSRYSGVTELLSLDLWPF